MVICHTGFIPSVKRGSHHVALYLGWMNHGTFVTLSTLTVQSLGRGISLSACVYMCRSMIQPWRKHTEAAQIETCPESTDFIHKQEGFGLLVDLDIPIMWQAKTATIWYIIYADGKHGPVHTPTNRGSIHVVTRRVWLRKYGTLVCLSSSIRHPIGISGLYECEVCLFSKWRSTHQRKSDKHRPKLGNGCPLSERR